MKAIIAALSLALVAVPAFAAKSYDSDSGAMRPSKGYIGIAAGKNTVAADSSTTWVASTATSVFGGYAFNERVAAEAAYTNLGTAETDPASTVQGTGSLISLSAVGTLPLGRVFSLYGKVGVGQSKFEVASTSFSESNTGVVYGLGGLFNIGQRAGIRVAYDKFKVGSTTPTDSSIVSVGALFKF